MLSYQGNGYYCYANSLHMALDGAGADRQALPAPGFLECLTTMPWGHTHLDLADGPLFFFSSPAVNPDTGLTLALRSLGWACRENVGGPPDEAVRLLRAGTQCGPVLVGPVDLGDLTYNPNHRNLSGVDHYVVVLSVEDDIVRLHDPAGFPSASIPIDDFLRSWQADRVPYRRGPFTCRWDFRKTAMVDRRTMISATLAAARRSIAVDPATPVVSGGRKALALLTEHLRGVVSPKLAEHLVWFALPLAARRAIDAAGFLAEAGRETASAIQGEKAHLFGEANYLAVQGRWAQVADLIEGLGTLETDLIVAL